MVISQSGCLWGISLQTTRAQRFLSFQFLQYFHFLITFLLSFFRFFELVFTYFEFSFLLYFIFFFTYILIYFFFKKNFQKKKKESTLLRDCFNARVSRCRQETVGSDLGGHRQVCGTPALKKIRLRLCAREFKTMKQGNIQRALFASELFSAMPPLEASKALVSIMISVSLSNKGKPLKLRHSDISRAHFQGTAQRLIYIRLPAEDRQKYGEDKVGRLIKSMYVTQDASHIWQLDYVSLICGESGGFRRGTHSTALFHNPNQDVRMAVHGDDFVSLPDDDGLKHIDSLLKSTYTAKDMGTFGFENSDAKSLQLLNRVFRVGTDQTGQSLDIEP